MTYTQLGMDSVFVLIFIVPVMIWQAAASRPMETIEITHRFNDMARMLFIGPVCTILVQGIAITIAVLSDKSERPVLPRWLSWPFCVERLAGVLGAGRHVLRVDRRHRDPAVRGQRAAGFARASVPNS
jgi:hypothetical protein